jgi:hypothetical protein
MSRPIVPAAVADGPASPAWGPDLRRNGPDLTRHPIVKAYYHWTKINSGPPLKVQFHSSDHIANYLDFLRSFGLGKIVSFLPILSLLRLQ